MPLGEERLDEARDLRVDGCIDDAVLRANEDRTARQGGIVVELRVRCVMQALEERRQHFLSRGAIVRMDADDQSRRALHEFECAFELARHERVIEFDSTTGDLLGDEGRETKHVGPCIVQHILTRPLKAVECLLPCFQQGRCILLRLLHTLGMALGPTLLEALGVTPLVSLPMPHRIRIRDEAFSLLLGLLDNPVRACDRIGLQPLGFAPEVSQVENNRALHVGTVGR